MAFDATSSAGLGGGRGLVHGFAEFHPGLVQIFQSTLECIFIFTLERIFHAGQRAFNVAALLRADLAAVFLEFLFNLEDSSVGLIFEIH